MSRATWLVGDVFDRLAELPDESVHSVISSPPYWRKRAYLPAGHPDGSKEVGQEPTPGEFLASMLRLTDELWRIVRDDGTIWINLGDTASGSGGSGGDYNPGGWREGQAKWMGSGRSAGEHAAAMPWKGKRDGHPLAKSVCWIPELFGASLAYGRNLLTGEPCRQWITRPPVVWCKPAPTPGEIIDKFREATELIVWAAKQPRYYFDLDAVREPGKGYERESDAARATPPGQRPRAVADTTNPKGVPPLTWWVVNTSGYEGAHFATFPPELIRRPVIASCPEGGTILDPFGGSGTTAMVATGHGRNCISIDLDARNADLARERVGMFLDVEERPHEPGVA
ncbi:MAG TPA: site-specific DNA-methyltransferase [Acidimicrobiales bacterium]|nr:site-specific DNA-methyltransferase [Acidimicrobiales bacterium]